MSDKVEISREWLSARIAEGLSQKAIGELKHVSHATIRTRMREYGLYNGNTKTKREGIWHDKDWLYQRRVVDKMEMHDIAKLAGCSYGTIQYELARHKFGLGYINRQSAVVAAAPVETWFLPDLDCLDCRRSSCVGCPLDAQ